MKKLAYILVIIYSLLNVTNAAADNDVRRGYGKGEEYKTQAINMQQRNRDKCTPNDIVLADYLGNENIYQPDAQPVYTPVDVAYSDYLADFYFFYQYTPNTCKALPESLQ